MVISKQGIVATNQTLASEAARRRWRAEARRRCRDRRECCDGRGRADEQRHGRRSVRHRLGCQERHADGNQCQRLGAEGLDHRAAQTEGDHQNAAVRHRFGHGAWIVYGWAKLGPALRAAALGRSVPAGDLFASNGFPVTELVTDTGRAREETGRDPTRRASTFRMAPRQLSGRCSAIRSLRYALELVAKEGESAFYRWRHRPRKTCCGTSESSPAA